MRFSVCAKFCRVADNVQRTEFNQKGTVFVEAAIATPILALLFAGVIQFGFAFGVLSSLRNASAVGARAAVLGTNPTNQQVCDAAKSSISGIIDVAQLACETSPAVLPVPGTTPVTITLSYPMRMFSANSLFGTDEVLSLTAHTTMQ
jgi:hypothetical protein